MTSSFIVSLPKSDGFGGSVAFCIRGNFGALSHFENMAAIYTVCDLPCLRWGLLTLPLNRNRRWIKLGGELIQTMLASSSDKKSGATASELGAVAILVTASGVFSEMQTGLNQAWQVKAPDQPVLLMLRARAASLGLVAALGFLLMVSLAASTALAALGAYLDGLTSFAPLLLAALNTLISLGLFTLLFAAISKVLPDTPISWREVGIGALITAVLFTVGKSLIGWYLGTTAASSGYGAAGALVLVQLWAYYCAQIFLFGAELTRAIAGRPPELAPAPDCRTSRASL